MAKSSLRTYTSITSHKSSGRGGRKIDKIFVHHMAGNLTVQQCGSVFHSAQASAHYGVNGKNIGCYVDENDTAWHCGNFAWNQQSIGIELANDRGASGDWHVSDSTLDTAIMLIADICKRNGIEELKYTGDLSGNLCMHCWVCSTACPGPYLKKNSSILQNRSTRSSTAPACHSWSKCRYPISTSAKARERSIKQKVLSSREFTLSQRRRATGAN